MKNVLVIGGGPAGMMAAYAAAKNGARVQLVERNKVLGKKMLITGKGRCNVTNFCDEEDLIAQVVSNRKFLYSSFASLNAYDAYALFEEWGVPLKIERGNRVFPVSDKAADVRNAMRDALKRCNVQIIEDRIKSVEAKTMSFIGENGCYKGDSVVLATGGISYSATGSSGDGYQFARSLGHRIIAPEAALVSMVEEGNDCADLMGLSLKNVQLTIFNCKGKKLYRDFGEMLFTHEGISGPIVLSASSYAKKGDFPLRAIIDLKPALESEALDKRLLRDFEEYANKDFRNSLGKLLPQKMIPKIIEKCGIPSHVKVHQITKQQRETLVQLIKNFEVKLISKGSVEQAVITSGGVDVREIDPKTMESKLVPGLFFAGEVMDVDALTGGYNLQIAYSTGYLAGLSAAKGDKNGN